MHLTIIVSFIHTVQWASVTLVLLGVPSPCHVAWLGVAEEEAIWGSKNLQPLLRPFSVPHPGLLCLNLLPIQQVLMKCLLWYSSKHAPEHLPFACTVLRAGDVNSGAQNHVPCSLELGIFCALPLCHCFFYINSPGTWNYSAIKSAKPY